MGEVWGTKVYLSLVPDLYTYIYIYTYTYRYIKMSKTQRDEYTESNICRMTACFCGCLFAYCAYFSNIPSLTLAGTSHASSIGNTSPHPYLILIHFSPKTSLSDSLFQRSGCPGTSGADPLFQRSGCPG